MNPIQKTRLLLTIWPHFVLSAITSPWPMHFNAALSPWPSSRIVPSQPPRPPFILHPSHLYASVLMMQLKCSRSQISTKLWWNISIIWRMEHILYLEPEATTAHYPLTAFRYGTRSVRSKCNTISARFPMPRRRCVPCPPRHLALTAYTMQS